jgi:hypothetical protein
MRVRLLVTATVAVGLVVALSAFVNAVMHRASEVARQQRPHLTPPARLEECHIEMKQIEPRVVRVTADASGTPTFGPGQLTVLWGDESPADVRPSATNEWTLTHTYTATGPVIVVAVLSDALLAQCLYRRDRLLIQ